MQDGARRWHANYTRVTQVPTYTALKSSPTGGLFRGNQSLGRESSHQAEFGVSDTLAGWSVETAAFWRRDDSLVDWTFRSGVTARTANPVDIDTAGFEAVARRAWSACDLVLGYTLLSKDADYRGALVDASFYALNYARQRLTAAITWRLGRGFELRMDNTARIQAGNLLRVTGGDRAVISSLGLTYRPAEWHGAMLTVQADNLWNSSFQEVPAVPAARRMITGGASYAW
jgi:outer membrane receptor protein involved in Fe transport